MRTLRTLCTTCLLLISLLGPHLASAAGTGTNQQPIVLSLPADTILTSVQKALPLDIPSQSRQLQGDITLESIDRLVIRDNIITVRGVLFGRNLVVLTNFGGQDVQVRLGEVRLPMTCDLQTRFDAARKKLFVTPRFSETAQNANNPQDPLAPLIGALGGREYAVDLDALETINLKVGAKSIPIAMDPIKIAALNNALVFHLLPRVGASR